MAMPAHSDKQPLVQNFDKELLKMNSFQWVVPEKRR
jgi:hypothetical protein